MKDKDIKFYVLKGYSERRQKGFMALCADVLINNKTHRLFLSSKNYFLYNELLEQMVDNGDIVDET